MIIVFFVSAFIILEAMALYSLSLRLLAKLYKNKTGKKIIFSENDTKLPMVTLLIVAHNEEKVILEKLQNVIALDYPKEKLQICVASDNSTDKTNEIVETFMQEYLSESIILHKTAEHKGKTNAQNEAQKLCKCDILVMTDANAILAKDAVKELVSSFVEPDIAYVAGRLCISNSSQNEVAGNENTYWDADLKMRLIESNLRTITAGNGALYACRNEMYHDFSPIESHDSAMPLYYALKGYRALFNPDAKAYEKAGEVLEDEWKRKVRMNRRILQSIIPSIAVFNPLKQGLFSYFYFGHRTCRYLLWIIHLLLLISSGFLCMKHFFFMMAFIGQIVFYLLALIKQLFSIENRYLNLIHYYCVTILAQWCGVYRILTGKTKPVWEKAESTRS